MKSAFRPQRDIGLFSLGLGAVVLVSTSVLTGRGLVGVLLSALFTAYGYLLFVRVSSLLRRPDIESLRRQQPLATQRRLLSGVVAMLALGTLSGWLPMGYLLGLFFVYVGMIVALWPARRPAA